MSQLTQTRKIYCRNNCGAEITFDSRKSRSGKSIPIDVGSGLPHQCPKSAYAQTQQSGSNITTAQAQTEPVKEHEDILHEILYEIQQLRKEVGELKL